MCLFFFQAEDGIRDGHVTGVQTCALPIYCHARPFDTPLEEGNIIEVICEAEVEYYQASLERPIIIGVGSPEVERAKIGRASCRERVEIAEGAVSVKRKKKKKLK